VFSELPLRLGNRDVTPDLCIYRDLDVDFAQDTLRVMDPPLVAVEIASLTQGMQDLIDRIRLLLEHGVPSFLLPFPLRSV
jgi:Uma2 family endonuclease